jgi:small subunit ribosomal protein S20
MYYGTRSHSLSEDFSLANKHAAEKAIRGSARRRVRNRVTRASARTQVKQAIAAIPEGDAAASEQAVSEAIRSLDRAAGKGVITKNNAARRKSRLMKKLNLSRSAPK